MLQKGVKIKEERGEEKELRKEVKGSREEKIKRFKQVMMNMKRVELRS